MKKVQSPIGKVPCDATIASWRLSGFCLCSWIALACGCQTERVTTSDGWRMPPPPHEAPQPPAALRADCMLFSVGSKPDDTNNNGFPDAIQVSVALFSSQHPISLAEEGAFSIAMYRQGQYGAADAQPMYQWKLSASQMQGALAASYAGPCYLFHVSLLQMGTDRLPLERADLVCRFEPADGGPAVVSDGVRIIQIGRRMSSHAQ